MPHTDGWFEYVEANFTGGYYYIGFADSLSSLSGTVVDIDYGILSYAGNYLYYFENGIANFISYTGTGNVVRIERSGDTIRYKVNGITLRTVTTTGISGKALKLKVYCYAPLKMVDVGCSFMRTDSVTFGNYVNVIPVISHSSGPGIADGSVTLTPKIPGAHSYTWQPGGATGATLSSLSYGTYTVTVQDSTANKSHFQYNVGYKVKWTNLNSGSYLGHDTLIGAGCSKNTLMPHTNGWFEYVEANFAGGGGYYLGFVDSLSSLSGTVADIDYGVLSYGANLYYYESGGASVMTSPVNGNIVRIERIGDTIRYKLNGITLRTVTATGISGKALKLKAYCYAPLKMVGVGCSFMHTDSVTFGNYVNVLPVISHSSGPGISDGSVALTPQIPGAHSYTWQPGGATGATLSSLSYGTYTVTVQDSTANKSHFQYNVGYKVKWTNLNSGSYLGHDTLIGAGCSKNTLMPHTNGWFEYVEANFAGGGGYYLGFVDSLSPFQGVVADIDYGILSYGTNLYYYESGSDGVMTSPVNGNIVRIERIGDTIRYKLNGITLRTVTATGISGKALKLKAYCYAPLKMVGVGCSFMHTDSTSFPNYVKVTPYISHSSGPGVADGSVSLTPAVPDTYTYRWADSTTSNHITKKAGNYAVNVADSKGNSSNYSYSIGYKVKWMNLSNCALQHDSLIGNDVWGQWGKASSKNVLNPGQDGWMEYVNTSIYSLKTFGFLDSIYDNLYNDIDFGFYFDNNNNYVYSFVNGSFTVIYSSPAIGDVFRLERVGNTVNFIVNGTLLQTSTVTGISQKKWWIKGVMYRSNIINLGCSFYPKLSPSVTYTNYTDSLNKGQLSFSVNGGNPPYNVVWQGNKLPSSNDLYHQLVNTYTGITVDSTLFKQKTDSIKQKMSYAGLNPDVYPVTIYDKDNDSLSVEAYIEAPVNWTYTTGVTTSDTNNIGLKKIGGVFYMYGNGHSITQQGTYSPGQHFAVLGNIIDLSRNNYVRFSVPSARDILYVGLQQAKAEVNGDTTDLSSQVMFRFNGNGTFNIIYHGSSIYFAKNVNGDVFSIENDPASGQLFFFQNESFLTGQPVSGISPTGGGYQAKMILAKAGAVISGIKIITPTFSPGITSTVTDVTCGNACSGSIQVSGYYNFFSLPVKYELYDQTNTLVSTIPITTYPNTVTFQNVCAGTYTVKYYVTVTSPFLTGTTPPPGSSATVVKTVDVAYKPGWTNTHYVTVSPSDNSLTKNTATNSFDAGATSVNVLNASSTSSQWLEWSPSPVATSDVFGLSASSANANALAINYGFANLSGPGYNIYFPLHNGSVVTLNSNTGFGTVTSSDKFRIEKTVSGTTYNLRFKINNNTVAQLLNITNVNLLADAAIHNGTINHPRVSFDCQAVACNSPEQYAPLANKLDGGYYTICSGSLYFTLKGEYGNGPLNYAVYNASRTLMTGLSVNNSTLAAGDNRYILNVNSLSMGYYILEVTNQKKEILTLRFKK